VEREDGTERRGRCVGAVQELEEGALDEACVVDGVAAGGGGAAEDVVA
jgi:hypothetical protein